MATYSTNQVGQLIVANAFNSSGTAAGTVIGTKGDASGVQVQYINANSQKVCSDRIPIANARYSIAKGYAAKSYRTDTITLAAANIVVGQEYSIKIIFRNWGSGSSEDQYTRVVGGYVAQTGDDAKDIFDAIAANATLTFSKDPYPLLVFTTTGSTTTGALVITEQAQPWQVGKMQGRQLDYSVLFVPIHPTSTTELVEWGTVVKVASNPGVGGGHEMADMEYFFMGERGDIYRNVGFPYTFNTTYLVDSTSYYDIVTLAYYYEGEGTNPQKSEKQLYILCKVVSGSHAIAQSVVGALVTAGFTIDDTSVTNFVTGIVVTGTGNATTITTDGGTLQMLAAVTPAIATDSTVVWSVAAGTGTGTISASGLLTAVTDGTVIVTATAHDGSGITGTKTITISNQA